MHGFAVDEEGQKMSKSIGNVVSPQNIIQGGNDLRREPAYGVDTLRFFLFILFFISLWITLNNQFYILVLSYVT